LLLALYWWLMTLLLLLLELLSFLAFIVNIITMLIQINCDCSIVLDSSHLITRSLLCIRMFLIILSKAHLTSWLRAFGGRHIMRILISWMFNQVRISIFSSWTLLFLLQRITLYLKIVILVCFHLFTFFLVFVFNPAIYTAEN